jgi:hypothetical protein
MFNWQNLHELAASRGDGATLLPGLVGSITDIALDASALTADSVVTGCDISARFTGGSITPAQARTDARQLQLDLDALELDVMTAGLSHLSDIGKIGKFTQILSLLQTSQKAAGGINLLERLLQQYGDASPTRICCAE